MQTGMTGLVLLTTCADNAEASLVRALLDADGIPCVVQGEQHRSMLGALGPYVELRVLVSERDLPRARELLEQAERDAAEAAGRPDLSVVPGGEDADPGAMSAAMGGDARAARRRALGWVAIGILFGPAVIGVLMSRCQGGA